MIKKAIFALAIMATVAATGIVTNQTSVACNTCSAATYDPNADGYIYKGTITLTRVISGQRDRFLLYNKRGVDYVATSNNGPFYRLSSRMKINGIDYQY